VNTSRQPALVMFSCVLLSLFGQQQKNATGKRPKQLDVTETSICEIMRAPFAYNNKLVRIRAAIEISFESSILTDPACGEQIWFALPDGSSPAAVGATVEQKQTTSKRIPIHLVMDSAYEEINRYLKLNAKGNACLDEPASRSSEPPDCTTYSIQATFTGRIDSVSRQVYLLHQKRTSADDPDFKGFGHMGFYDAQLTLQSVRNIVAVRK